MSTGKWGGNVRDLSAGALDTAPVLRDPPNQKKSAAGT
jgi:hypothetical protein